MLGKYNVVHVLPWYLFLTCLLPMLTSLSKSILRSFYATSYKNPISAIISAMSGILHKSHDHMTFLVSRICIRGKLHVIPAYIWYLLHFNDTRYITNDMS